MMGSLTQNYMLIFVKLLKTSPGETAGGTKKIPKLAVA